MTFTEAAVEILRLVGKPLHYKKITELALERNLLSHVGKTPETTMSSRLATMVRKDRGDAPVVKIKPGVFGLREFSPEILAKAEKRSGHDAKLPKESEASTETEVEADPERKAPEVSNHPGADVFPDEEDDDEPILASLKRKETDSTNAKEQDGDSRRSKRRRRRGRRGEEEAGERNERGDRPERSRRGRDRDRDRDRDRGRDGRRGRSRKKKLDGDWERQLGPDDSSGLDLADAVEGILGRRPKTLLQVAERLVQSGRLNGDPASLAPTIAAAIRGDGARRLPTGAPPRLSLDGDEVTLLSARYPGDAVRAERDAYKASKRQGEIVRRAFVKRLLDLPSASLLELIATWLNAVGVVGVRGVRPPGNSGEFHLAGTLRLGTVEQKLAIVVARRTELSREMVIETRGSLHHYGQAKAVWLVTLGQALRGAKDESTAEGAAPVALFDGLALAASMEQVGIGLRRWSIPMVQIDFDLLDALRGPGASSDKEDSGKDETGSAEGQEGEASDDDNEDESTGTPRRRRRRRKRRGGADAEKSEGDNDESSSAEAAEGTDSADSDSGETEAADDSDENETPDENIDEAGDEEAAEADETTDDDDGSETDDDESEIVDVVIDSEEE